MEWLRILWEKISEAFSNCVDFIVDCGSWVVDHVASPLRAIWTFLEDAWDFLVDVLAHRQRHWRDLFIGLPATILAIALGVITIAGYFDQQSSFRMYWALGEQALAEEKPETAEIYLQKALVNPASDQNKITLALARTYEKMGSLDRAAVLMDSIAPLNEVGHPRAHLYLATQMAAKNAEGQQVDLKAWDWHIRNADKKDPYFVDKLRSDYYLALGDEQKSLEYVTRVAEAEPNLWFFIAQRHNARNNPEAAQAALDRGREAYERLWKADPGNLEKRLQYATALLLTKRAEEARTLVLEAYQRSPDPRLAIAMSNVCNVEVDLELARSNAVERLGLGKVAKLLTEAIAFTPNHPGTLERIGRLATSEKSVVDEFRSALADQIARGVANQHSFYILGVLEFEAGDLEAAQRYTRQSLKLVPDMQTAANNLAYYITQAPTPDLDEALSLANIACKGNLQLADFYDTRGVVYAMRGEIEPAITDYLKALTLPGSPPKLREKLAELYDKTGDKRLSDAMRAEEKAAKYRRKR